MTKGQLVDMDNRFLEWLRNSGVNFPIVEALKYHYITVHETDDSEVDIMGYEIMSGLKKMCADTISEHSGWELVAIFDLKKKKEIKFREVIKVEVEGVDY